MGSRRCGYVRSIARRVSPGRSSLDALLFFRETLKDCRGQPRWWLTAASGTTGRLISSIVTGSEKRGETAHSSKRGSVFSSTEPCCSDTGFPTTARENQQKAGSQPSPHSTMHSSKVNTPSLLAIKTITSDSIHYSWAVLEIPIFLPNQFIVEDKVLPCWGCCSSFSLWLRGESGVVPGPVPCQSGSDISSGTLG